MKTMNPILMLLVLFVLAALLAAWLALLTHPLLALLGTGLAVAAGVMAARRSGS